MEYLDLGKSVSTYGRLDDKDPNVVGLQLNSHPGGDIYWTHLPCGHTIPLCLRQRLIIFGADLRPNGNLLSTYNFQFHAISRRSGALVLTYCIYRSNVQLSNER